MIHSFTETIISAAHISEMFDTTADQISIIPNYSKTTIYASRPHKSPSPHSCSPTWHQTSTSRLSTADCNALSAVKASPAAFGGPDIGGANDHMSLQLGHCPPPASWPTVCAIFAHKRQSVAFYTRTKCTPA
jgi:hypothetical protein